MHLETAIGQCRLETQQNIKKLSREIQLLYLQTFEIAYLVCQTGQRKFLIGRSREDTMWEGATCYQLLLIGKNTLLFVSSTLLWCRMQYTLHMITYTVTT